MMVLNEDSDFRTSSYCGNGACVEVAIRPDRVHIRNSTDPSGPALALGHDEWNGFIARVKIGRL